MRPDVPSPARDATRTECRMHTLMAELVAGRRFADALGCRAQLARVSARRAEVATAELALTTERPRAADTAGADDHPTEGTR